MTDRRPLLRSIFDAAVAGGHPDVILAAHLPPAPNGKVICLAAGKGAAALAAAAERHYLDTRGLGPPRLSGRPTPLPGRAAAGWKPAAHPLRPAAGPAADDLLLVLVSGGGSANWIAPVDGVTFAQQQLNNRGVPRSRGLTRVATRMTQD